MNVLIVGYYNHYNLGDEQYKISISYFLNHRIFGMGRNASQNSNFEVDPSEDVMGQVPLQIFKWINSLKPQSKIDFIDCDQIFNFDTSPYSTILLGGGDVLNTYFLDKLNKKFPYDSLRPTIIAFSVGIPYNSIFTQPDNIKKLDIFDHIFLRTKQDSPMFAKYFDKQKFSYLPDSSCFLLDSIEPLYQKTRTNSKHINYPVYSTNELYLKLYSTLLSLSKTKKIINVNLCRHIYNENSPYLENYNAIIRELAKFITDLIKKGYYIVLLPFNTKPTKEGSLDSVNHENDILIQQDILNLIQDHSRIFNINYELSVPEVLSLYPFFYVSIPMRFHGTLFSIHAGVPMIPIYTTKKIKNLLLDIDWKYEYVLDKNERDLPTSFSSNKMMMIFLGCIKYHTKCKLHLKESYDGFKRVYRNQSRFILNKLCTEIKREPNILLENSIVLIENNNNEKSPVLLAFEKLQNFAEENNYTDFRLITDATLKGVAVNIASYYLTGNLDSRYNDGMASKMFSLEYNYEKEWDWVINHHKNNITPSQKLPNNPKGLFNIDFIDQNDQSGAHRSGWKYVYDNIKHLHTSNSNILLDLYVDRTFHWKLEVYKYIGLLPYKTPWMGVIHHTFDTTFSEYNNNTLFECPEFIESLRTCRGLIVLSQYLKQQFETEFDSRGIIGPPLYVLRHPTEIDVPNFSIDAFMENPNKRLIHIGGWLRNIFSFYQLKISGKYNLRRTIEAKIDANIPDKVAISRCLYHLKNAFSVGRDKKKQVFEMNVLKPEKTVLSEYIIKKSALKGRFMSNYYPCDGFLDNLKNMIRELENKNGIENTTKYCSQDMTITNNWNKEFFKYMENLIDEIEIIEALNNSEYDDLLTRNIVFLNLVDSSAINTLLECVMRNTPIIINRHPAVEEVIGKEYPLYYTSIDEVDGLLKNPKSICDAHSYLCKIDKTIFHIESFIDEISKIFKQNA